MKVPSNQYDTNIIKFPTFKQFDPYSTDNRKRYNTNLNSNQLKDTLYYKHKLYIDNLQKNIKDNYYYILEENRRPSLNDLVIYKNHVYFVTKYIYGKVHRVHLSDDCTYGKPLRYYNVDINNIKVISICKKMKNQPQIIEIFENNDENIENIDAYNTNTIECSDIIFSNNESIEFLKLHKDSLKDFYLLSKNGDNKILFNKIWFKY